MQELNLDRLNVNAPYSVWKVTDGTYGFKTSYGILYRIVFIDDQTIWTSGAYEFGIINQSRKASPNDKKVRDTIFCIIEEFFACNPEILLYQCETGDNKQALRDRLFLRWFNEYRYSDRYFIKVSTIVAEDVSNYAAIIVQRSNPNLDRIVKDFDAFVGFFQDKPE